MMTRRSGAPRLLALALLPCALVGGSSCRRRPRGPALAGAGLPGPRPGGVLRVAFLADLETLDPATASYVSSAEAVLDDVADTLVAYGDGDVALAPQLAESFTISPDQLVYTFHLRPDARFSDGNPVTAADFAYALERVRDPALHSPGAQWYEGIMAIDASDPHTLVLRLAAPNPIFLHLLAMKYATPVERAVVLARGAGFATAPILTGPFAVRRFEPGREIDLVRNDQYWCRGHPELPCHGLPYLDGVRIRLHVSREDGWLELRAGDVDLAGNLSSPDYLAASADPAWRALVEVDPLLGVFGDFLNVEIKPFDDRRVRQAMNLAIDRAHLVTLASGRIRPSNGPLPPDLPGYDPAIPVAPHDPVRARALLAEAGYGAGFAVTYVAIAGDDLAAQIAESIQADLAAIGVRMTIRQEALPAYLATVGTERTAAFGEAGYSADFPDASDFLATEFASGSATPTGSTNPSFYRSPAVDALLAEASHTADATARTTLLARAAHLVHDDYPMIWEYVPTLTLVRQPYVMGFRFHPVWTRSVRSVWLDLPLHPIP